MHLIIGNTSQLAQYFPQDYMKISSRNIDFDFLKNNKWESVYITFAEQRIYDSNIDYITPNYINTLNIINTIIDNANKIVCYGTCMLWERLTGTINAKDNPNFYLCTPGSEYTISKFLLLNRINELRKINSKYNKVIFMHPFYFNSIHRSNYFLFGKVFDSIINKKKIYVNNLDFKRDMVSPQFVVNKSIELTKDSMMSSGKLFNVKTFIKDLYELNNLNFDEYIAESDSSPAHSQKLQIVGDVDWKYTYKNLLEDTQRDILTVRKV